MGAEFFQGRRCHQAAALVGLIQDFDQRINRSLVPYVLQRPDGRDFHIRLVIFQRLDQRDHRGRSDPLKCDGSPHIYRLENQAKRWIKDIETFEAEGHVWEDVRFVSCQYLRDLPDGPPVPEDAGPPPEP